MEVHRLSKKSKQLPASPTWKPESMKYSVWIVLTVTGGGREKHALKFLKSSFFTEALIQIPVSQDQEGVQLERKTGFMAGIRYMF